MKLNLPLATFRCKIRLVHFRYNSKGSRFACPSLEFTNQELRVFSRPSNIKRTSTLLHLLYSLQERLTCSGGSSRCWLGFHAGSSQGDACHELELLHIRLSTIILVYHTRVLGKMVNMNVFRIFGDLSHTASKCILIWAIHANQSAEGNDLCPCPMYFANGTVLRCITDYPDAVCWCLHHPLPRSLLDSAFRIYMEFHSQEFLHSLFALYHLSHDESLCSNAGKRKGVEIRGILSGGINGPGAHRHGHCRKEKL